MNFQGGEAIEEREVVIIGGGPALTYRFFGMAGERH